MPQSYYNASAKKIRLVCTLFLCRKKHIYINIIVLRLAYNKKTWHFFVFSCKSGACGKNIWYTKGTIFIKRGQGGKIHVWESQNKPH